MITGHGVLAATCDLALACHAVVPYRPDDADLFVTLPPAPALTDTLLVHDWFFLFSLGCILVSQIYLSLLLNRLARAYITLVDALTEGPDPDDGEPARKPSLHVIGGQDAA